MLLVLDLKPPIHPPLVGVLDPTPCHAQITWAEFTCVSHYLLSSIYLTPVYAIEYFIEVSLLAYLHNLVAAFHVEI